MNFMEDELRPGLPVAVRRVRIAPPLTMHRARSAPPHRTVRLGGARHWCSEALLVCAQHGVLWRPGGGAGQPGCGSDRQTYSWATAVPNWVGDWCPCVFFPTQEFKEMETLRRTRSYKSMDEFQRSHMMKVHAMVGLGLACAALGAKQHMDATTAGSTDWLQGGHHMTFVQVACIAILGVGEIGARTEGISLFRTAVYLVCALAAGLNVGTWIVVAAQENGLCKGDGLSFFPDLDFFRPVSNQNVCKLFEEVLYSSLLLTAGAYACFFVAATVSPPGNAQVFAPFVVCGLYILSLTYWVSAAFGWMGSEGFDIIYVQMGLVVYCIKVYVDTQEIYERVAKGERDVVSHALKVFLNICHLFIRSAWQQDPFAEQFHVAAHQHYLLIV